MYKWLKDIAQWRIKDTLYLSVVFTWDLPKARLIAEHKPRGIRKVVAGGPAVNLLPDYLKDVADVQRETIFPALAFHNPMATFTTRGCPNKCSFCAVPKTEGDLIELESWEPRPIVSDNNLLAASWEHFVKVLALVQHFPFIDFNGGLDARLFDDAHAQALARLNKVMLTFAFDHINQERDVVRAIETAKSWGHKNIRVYVLIGHEDSPDDAFYRLELVRSLSALPFPQRFQPLYALKKNEYVAEGWTDLELKRMSRYYSRLNYLGHIPYAEYRMEDAELNQGMLV